MCIANIGCKSIKARVRKLPKLFPVWKVMSYQNKDYNLYDPFGKSPIRDGINKAERLQDRRMEIPYAPGFHSFLRKKDALSRIEEEEKQVRKFWARKAWITESGIGTESFLHESWPIVVLSHIATDKASAEEIQPCPPHP